jgi:hypothetical protein
VITPSAIERDLKASSFASPSYCTEVTLTPLVAPLRLTNMMASPRSWITASLLAFAFVAAALYVHTFFAAPAAYIIPVFHISNLGLFATAIICGRKWGAVVTAPRWVANVWRGLILFTLLNFALALSGGMPVQKDGQFFKRSVSAKLFVVETAVDAVEYGKLQSGEFRIFASVWIALDLGGGFLLLSTGTITRKEL